MIYQSAFFRHLLTLLSGTALGQLIAIVTMPLITRLYNPSEFALVSAFIGLSTVLSIFATLRYELAILLPHSEDEAESVMILAFGFLLSTTVLIFLALIFFGDYIFDNIKSYQMLKDVMYFFAPMTLVLGGIQILNAWANRHRKYDGMAIANISGQSGNAIIAILLGFFKSPVNGLVVGRVLGQAMGTFTLLFRLRKTIPSLSIEIISLKYAAWRYRQFPIFNVPYSVMGVMSQELLVLLLLAYHYGEIAGYFALVRTLLLMPARYLSSSLGVVFFREASQLMGTPELEALTLKIMKRLALPALPFLVVLFFWAESIFELGFGANWSKAGHVAVYYVPVAFLFLLTSWPERLYEIAEKQKVSLSIELSGNLLKLGVVLYFLMNGHDAMQAVLGYVIVDALYHLAYLVGLFYVGGFRQATLCKFMCEVLFYLVIATVLCVLIKGLPISLVVQAVLTLFALGALAAYATIVAFRDV